MRKKRDDASAFDPAVRPLWLIVTLNEELTFDVDGSGRAQVEAALRAETTIAPFDRVVVELLDRPPVVRDT